MRLPRKVKCPACGDEVKVRYVDAFTDWGDAWGHEIRDGGIKVHEVLGPKTLQRLGTGTTDRRPEDG